MNKNKTLKKHEKEYLHIQKRSIKFISISILMLFLTIGIIYVTIESWKFLEIGGLNFENYKGFHQLLIIPLVLIDYIIISLTICSFVSIFKKLKSFDEEGLFVGIIKGLVEGIFVGLVEGIFVGLVLGIVLGIVEGIIGAIFVGLIFGLVFANVLGIFVGLVLGNVLGLLMEFN